MEKLSEVIGILPEKVTKSHLGEHDSGLFFILFFFWNSYHNDPFFFRCVMDEDYTGLESLEMHPASSDDAGVSGIWHPGLGHWTNSARSTPEQKVVMARGKWRMIFEFKMKQEIERKHLSFFASNTCIYLFVTSNYRRFGLQVMWKRYWSRIWRNLKKYKQKRRYENINTCYVIFITK